jgi:putative DNA primase/helicase
VRTWWEKWPECNIAIVTGAASGLIVLDVDNKNGKNGSRTLSELAKQHSWTPETRSVTTGTGQHLYFRMPEVAIRTRVQGLGEGLDVKGDGGYVVAPPSTHASMSQYCWDDPNAELTNLPQWLVSAICSREFAIAECAVPTVRGSLPIEEGDAIQQGCRNVTLFRKACGMRGKGYGLAAIEATLRGMNALHCDPPLSSDEVALIARRAMKYEVGFVISQKEKQTFVG